VPEDTQAFFAEAAASGDNGCVDCDHYDAPWATVSHGAYLCVDCAGKHRGLGVHLSFVRSTTMDQWSKQQLRRMQLGGTKRLQEFFQGYPELRDAPSTRAALATKYGSRAAGYYRRLLDARCRDSPEEAAAEEAELAVPPAAEGHLADTTNTTIGQSVTASSGSSGGGCSPSGGGGLGDDGEGGHTSLEQEREALRQLVLRHTREGDNPGSPARGLASLSEGAAAPAAAAAGSTSSPTSGAASAAVGTAAAAGAAAAVAAAASVAAPPARRPEEEVAMPAPTLQAMPAPAMRARPPAQTDDSEGGI